jgi:hypothetical protein
MQSPPIEWALAIGYLGVLDYLRSRGEADADTLSEVVRDAVYRHRHGKAAFTVGLAVGAVALHRHIVRE